jgi:hypothetical protein
MKAAKKIDNKAYSVKLTEKQANLLIETLLFASSVNIGSEWSDDDKTELVDLAVIVKNTIGEGDLSLKNLTFYDDEELCEPWTSKIQQNFEIEHFEIKTLESI